MLCGKFGYICLIGCGEENENVKSLQIEGQQAIRKAHLSSQLRWAKIYKENYKLDSDTYIFWTL